jgi:hypothetical protein
MRKFLVTLLASLIFGNIFTIGYALDLIPSAACVDQGSTSSGCAKTLATAAGSKKATLLFKHNKNTTKTTYTFTTSYTIPSNVDVEVEPGAVLAGTVTGIKKAKAQWFGAEGDGSTNDQPALQAMINSMMEGGTVEIPAAASYYKVTATQLSEALTVTIRLNIIVDGELRATAHTAQANPPFIMNITGTGTTVSGRGTFRGNGSYVVNTTTVAQRPGLIQVAASDVTISGLTFVNPQEVGIYVTGANRVSIIDCAFTGGPLIAGVGANTNHYYILHRNTNNLTVARNRFYADATAGAAIQGITGSLDTKIKIVGNHFTDMHEHAIYTYSENGLCDGNIISYSQTVANQRGTAIVFGGAYNVITNNVIRNALLGGMSIRGAIGNVVAHNSLYNVGYGGIILQSFVSEFGAALSISNNIISNNYLKAATSGSIFDGIRYYAESTIEAISYGGKIKDNILIGWGDLATDASYASIAVWSNTVTYPLKSFEISGNFITGSNGYGIYLTNIDRLHISHNTFYNNPLADFQCIWALVATKIKVESNLADDYQGLPTLYSLFSSSADTADIFLLNNEVYGASIVNPFNTNLTRNILGRGNRTSRTQNLTGTFTMNNVATKTISNTNVTSSTVDDNSMNIIITAKSPEAALVMGSAKALYLFTATAGAEFTVKTSNATTVPATDHIFHYEIVQ